MDTILDCAAFWFHVVGIKTAVSLQLVNYLLRDLFDSGAALCLNHDPTLLVKTSPAFCATFVTATTFIYPMRLPPKALLELLATWLTENLYLSYVPLETVMSTAQTFVPGLTSWIVLSNSRTETDAVVMNKLHLALLKIIIRAPQGIIQVRRAVTPLVSSTFMTCHSHAHGGLRSISQSYVHIALFQADHFVKLSEVLENPEELQVERFVQILQAALTASCVQGKTEELRGVLEKLPPIQLTEIVLENNLVDSDRKKNEFGS